MKIRPVTERQTDTTKLKVNFRNSANAPKISTYTSSINEHSEA